MLAGKECVTAYVCCGIVFDKASSAAEAWPLLLPARDLYSMLLYVSIQGQWVPTCQVCQPSGSGLATSCIHASAEAYAYGV